jgi:hypothetical protein
MIPLPTLTSWPASGAQKLVRNSMRFFRFRGATVRNSLEFPERMPDCTFAIWGTDARDEATRFAALVVFLKQSDVIADYSQIALLLHSVRLEHSGPYLAALETKGIPAFCPRARTYFDNDEVRLMVACLAVIFGYYGEGRGDIHGAALADLAAYVDAGIIELGRRYGGAHPLLPRVRLYAVAVGGDFLRAARAPEY